MILLDTNIVSEMMKPLPNTKVVDWLNRQDSSALYLSTPTVAEVWFGIAALPVGKRRRALDTGFARLTAEEFEGRIWTFDTEAAAAYGRIMAKRRAKGRPLSVMDGQIAAIAKARNATVATRNVRDFAGCGVKVANPFA
jgi:toxin FitB